MGNAAPFADAALPFFALHARVWLVSAFSSIAIEDPKLGVRYRKVFEDILRDCSAPHAILRQLAAKAMNAVLDLIPRVDRAELKRLIATDATPPHGYRRVTGYNRPNAYVSPPDEKKREFYFEYDFHKYEINGLAHVFGLPTWQVERLCEEKVKTLDPAAEHYTDTGTKWKKYMDMEEYGTISGSAPRKDLWGTYLSWHALLQTAADLYLSKPVVRYYDDSTKCEWDEWLTGYSPLMPDGRWRADTTELFPAEFVRRPWARPEGDLDKLGPLPVDAEDLVNLIELDGQRVRSDWLTLAGYWHAPSGFIARVSSAFISTKVAEYGAWAVMSASTHDRWLPTESDDYHRPKSYAEQPFSPSMGRSFDRRQGLDRRDPYASSRAYPDDCPASAIVQEYQLQSRELGRNWYSQNKCVMQVRAWGGKKFYARNEEDTEGSDFQCNCEWLFGYLTKHNFGLALLISADWYRRITGRETEHLSKQLLVVILPDRRFKTYATVPPDVMAIVGSIREEQYDLRVRYKAIVEAASSMAAAPVKRQGRKRASAKKTKR